jgi:hypothetical protein
MGAIKIALVKFFAGAVIALARNIPVMAWNEHLED